MERLRLAVKKEGALQFLSHLDFARCVRYVIIRARLPILYSEGFNPHMKLSFASALGVGVGADVEYLDMELAELVPVADVIERMNAVSPDGFSVQDGKYVDAKAPKLMAVANYAVYDIKGPVIRPISQDELDGILKAFNEKPDVAYEKVSVKKGHKVRLIAVKNHVIEPVSGIVKKRYGMSSRRDSGNGGRGHQTAAGVGRPQDTVRAPCAGRSRAGLAAGHLCPPRWDELFAV